MRRVDIPVFLLYFRHPPSRNDGAGMNDTLKTQAKEIRDRGESEHARRDVDSHPTGTADGHRLPPGIFIVLIGPLLFDAFGVSWTNTEGFRGNAACK